MDLNVNSISLGYNSVETNLRFHGIVQYPMLSSSVQSV